MRALLYSRWLRPAVLFVAATQLALTLPAAADATPAPAPPRSGARAPAVVPGPQKATEGAPIDAEKLFAAIVKVQTVAVPNARSASSLGREREGTGIVIGDGGLIVTIGYLLVEAGQVTITDNRGRSLPGEVVGYDTPSGLGLVRTLVPLRTSPIALGDSDRLAEREPVMVANEAGANDVSFVWVVSRRVFTGGWEYMLDRAIFTSPPTLNWSGAALIDRDGKLVGVGSLLVREATEGDAAAPGNMFVPIDLLKPALGDLVRNGRRSGPAQPWLGLATDEVQGRLLVTRVSPDGPADRAGLRRGDIILGVGTEGVRTQADFYRKLWSRGHAGDEITLRVLQDVDVKDVRVRSIDRIDYYKTRTTF